MLLTLLLPLARLLDENVDQTNGTQRADRGLKTKLGGLALTGGSSNRKGSGWKSWIMTESLPFTELQQNKTSSF